MTLLATSVSVHDDDYRDGVSCSCFLTFIQGFIRDLLEELASNLVTPFQNFCYVCNYNLNITYY